MVCLTLTDSHMDPLPVHNCGIDVCHKSKSKCDDASEAPEDNVVIIILHVLAHGTAMSETTRTAAAAANGILYIFDREWKSRGILWRCKLINCSFSKNERCNCSRWGPHNILSFTSHVRTFTDNLPFDLLKEIVRGGVYKERERAFPMESWKRERSDVYRHFHVIAHCWKNSAASL